MVDEVIRVFIVAFRNAQSRAEYLLNGATNLSSFDQQNFNRAQSTVNATTGDSSDQTTRRLLGNRGPTVDSVMQGATDAVSTSNDISNVNIAVQNGLLIVPVPGNSSSTTGLNPSEEEPGQGFSSFGAFKRNMGSAGENNEWHHIVEQRSANVEKFGAEAIHNSDNLISVSKDIHTKVSGYYSSKQDFTGGKTVRDWLSTKTYKEQYEFGMNVLRKFGWQP